jgi:hypothetical protein
MREVRSFRLGMRAAAASAAACLVVAGVALAAPALPAPEVIGDWQGAISTGSGSLHVVVHVSQDKDGKLTGTMDSPDQGATGIVISSVTFAQPEFDFAIEKLGAGYAGKLDSGKSLIAGVWKQGSASLPLTLSRVKK